MFTCASNQIIFTKLMDSPMAIALAATNMVETQQTEIAILKAQLKTMADALVAAEAQLKAMADALAAAEARAETSENAFAVLVKYSATKRS